MSFLSFRQIITTKYSHIICNRNFSTKLHQHIPLIKFVGKRGKHESDNHINDSVVKSVSSSSSRSISLSISVAATPPKISFAKPIASKPIKSSPNAVEFQTLKGKAMFGRPKFYDDELEAIMSGGATEVV